jgi:four helix bundle protein
MKFEDLETWQAARRTVNAVYDLTRKGDISKDFGLRDQLQRASVSVMTNIAEGFERTSPAEKLHFYNIARASCGEVRSLLYVVEDNYPNSLEHLPLLRESVNSTGSLLSGLMASTRKHLIGKATGLIALLLLPATYLITHYSL